MSASIFVHAQTPAPAKGTASKTGAAHTTAAGTRPSLLNPASLKLKSPAVFKAKFTTTAGDFVVEVHRDWAPIGADRFYNLVRYGYFTNASFFRVVPGFVVQFGLSANPAINKAWHAAKIQDDPVVQSNKRGYLVFATAGPNTRTTQFFINYADNARLDGMGFASFGQINSGMNVVDQLYADYGEGAPSGRGPNQGRIQGEGNAYLTRDFPNLDFVRKATISQ